MMRVYVATAFHNRVARARVIDELRCRGHTITFDWAEHTDLPLEEAGCCDILGVREADVLIVLLPGGRGTHVELGIALGTDVPAVIVAMSEGIEGWIPGNADQGQCPFYVVPGVTLVDDVEAALNYVDELAPAVWGTEGHAIGDVEITDVSVVPEPKCPECDQPMFYVGGTQWECLVSNCTVGVVNTGIGGMRRLK